MPQIIYSDQSNRDLARLSEFMAKIEPTLRSRVVITIVNAIEQLKTFPEIAKPSQDKKYQHMRELFIPFGAAGYAALYEYQEKTDTVLIASIRHVREAGYKLDQ
jgi:plasmid stabilization system protein ParE